MRLATRPVFRCIAGLIITGSLCLGASGPALAQPAPARESIAVLDLESAGASPVEVSALSDRLREEMLRSGRFTLIERERLTAVLEEQTIQQATCEGRECALRVGRVLGVSKIVTGRATKLGADSWQISAQLIDVQTAETLAAESVIREGRFVDLLQQGMPELAAKLAGQSAAPPLAAAPPAAAQAPPPTETPPPAEPEPPADESSVRLYMSPFTAYQMGLTLDFGGNEVTESIGGTGISLGFDAFVTPEMAFWVAFHGGSVTSWEIKNQSSTFVMEDVEGSFSALTLGLAAVFGTNPFHFLLGGGLFTTSADLEGYSPDLNQSFVSDASVAGILLQLRFDYTFENGLLIGAGLDIGAGSASGTETEGASSASGTMVLFYFPIGFAF